MGSALKTLQAQEAINALKVLFGHLPIPQVIRSDNATQFANALMKEFMATMGIDHVFSTPLRPQSIGEASEALTTPGYNDVRTFRTFKLGLSSPTMLSYT